VHEQQRCYLQQTNDDRPVRTAFREDFADALASWLQAGDQIIVGGDVNESVFHQSILNIFQAHAMRNFIFDMHPSPTPKKTYLMSNEHRVVDRLWATPGIQVTRCGYLELREFTGNHSLLWADISFASALGHNPPDPITPQARRLKLGYSHVVDKYLAIYEKLIHRHNLID
jgi:hypothetical protein